MSECARRFHFLSCQLKQQQQQQQSLLLTAMNVKNKQQHFI